MKLARKLKLVSKKPEYQTFERITYQEVDDASNFQPKKIAEKALYETNRAQKDHARRMYKMTFKDYSADGKIEIKVIDEDEVRKDCPDYGTYGYLNISCVQIIVKWLGNAGINIPLKIAMIDRRLENPKQGIIGLYSTNLFSGSTYTEIHTDFTLSMKDQNLGEAFVIIVDPTIDLIEGSKALSIGVHSHMSWNATSRAYRLRDKNGINTGDLAKGKSVIIKETGMNVQSIPQPVPVEKLDYDLDFEFKKPRKVVTQAGTSTEVQYCVQTKEALNIKLSSPTLDRSTSRMSKRFNDESLSNLFES